jgi:hypothetical protein
MSTLHADPYLWINPDDGLLQVLKSEKVECKLPVNLPRLSEPQDLQVTIHHVTRLPRRMPSSRSAVSELVVITVGCLHAMKYILRPIGFGRGQEKVPTGISQCRACGSANVHELVAEACLHFPGLKGLKTEPIFIFPETVVCLDCGFVESSLSGGELEQIRNGAARVNAASA